MMANNGCPCVQDCPRRTGTCKVDGSCPEFIEYDKARMKGYEEKRERGERWYATNPFFGAAHQRIIKQNVAYQLKKMRGHRA